MLSAMTKAPQPDHDVHNQPPQSVGCAHHGLPRRHSVESRFDALHATGLTELAGRKEELELLLRRWSKAKTGEGQVVLLSGEPGIGKSRLTAALLERVASEPHTRLRYFCSPQRNGWHGPKNIKHDGKDRRGFWRCLG